MPIQQTSGNVTADAYGGGVAAVPNYIENVFSTWLYQGNGSTQTITNGIDLAGKGGMVWIKNRGAVANHAIGDTDILGFGTYLSSNTTAGASVDANTFQTFNNNGFTIKQSTLTGASTNNYASWTFRKQPKFFDVVTYTGNGTSSNAVSHALASQPAFIITKRTDSTGNWIVWHRTGTSWVIGYLNTTGSMPSAGSINASVTSTQVNIGAINAAIGENANISGASYVMYLFAHNAGGFGLTGTDNVISCGSFTTDGSGNATVSLGYEPQWILYKNATSGQNWFLVDSMRGMANQGASTSVANTLSPNTSGAEVANNLPTYPTATGFQVGLLTASATYIYIAIRRGPMKVPTDGTKVFASSFQTANSTATNPNYPANFPVDLMLRDVRAGGNSAYPMSMDRLRGGSPYLTTSSTAAETADSTWAFDSMTGVYAPVGVGASTNVIGWLMRRAPGFFDEVCYNGTGAGHNEAHNLGVAPEMMIVKSRSSGAAEWNVYVASLGNNSRLWLQSTMAVESPRPEWGYTTPTASVFSVGSTLGVNATNQTYVAYLFASCPGVSKCFNFTGNGTTQTINCGFTGGARFVLLKAASATGGWYVYDTARGMTTLTDPYLFLNSTAVETATLGSVTTVSTGFAVNEAITTGVNTNGVTYVGIAIA